MHMNSPASFPLRARTRCRAPRSRRRLIALVLASFSLVAGRAAAQTTGPIWDFPQPHPVGEHVNATTRVVLRSVVPVYAAPPAPAVIHVPASGALELALPVDPNEMVSVTWFKDGEALAKADRTLVISQASAADDGLYTAQVKRAIESPVLYSSLFETIRVEVGESRSQKLVNISTRSTVSPANPSLIVGFVVDGPAARSDRFSYLLIRAVGPSLADYGVAHPLAAPKVTLFDAKGNPIPWPEMFIPEWNPYALAKAVAPIVGAAPLRTDSQDFAILQPLPAGAYTAHVTAADGGSGDVMLEIYQVAEDSIPVLETEVPTDPKG